MRQVVSIVTYTALVVCAQIPVTAGLVDNSPFVPPQQKSSHTPDQAPVIASGNSNKYALKGIMFLAGQYHFSILDQETQKSRWLNLDQKFEGLSLLAYDEGSKQLLVRYQNRAIRLPLSLESNISVAVIRGGPVSATPPKAPAISRRPNAFTANNFNSNITKASDSTLRAAPSISTRATGFGNSTENRLDDSSSTNPDTNPTAGMPSANPDNASGTAPDFSHRFGIDQSRTSYVPPPPELEEDEEI